MHKRLKNGSIPCDENIISENPKDYPPNQTYTVNGLICEIKDPPSPIPKARLVLHCKDPKLNNTTAITEEHGYYVFSGLTAGEYKVHCTAKGYVPVDTVFPKAQVDKRMKIFMDFDFNIGMRKK